MKSICVPRKFNLNNFIIVNHSELIQRAFQQSCQKGILFNQFECIYWVLVSCFHGKFQRAETQKKGRQSQENKMKWGLQLSTSQTINSRFPELESLPLCSSKTGDFYFLSPEQSVNECCPLSWNAIKLQSSSLMKSCGSHQLDQYLLWLHLLLVDTILKGSLHSASKTHCLALLQPQIQSFWGGLELRNSSFFASLVN